jgi:predicted Zn-dependent protease
MTAARLVLAGLLLNQKQTSEATKQLQILITQLPNSDPQLSALLAQLQALQTTD